MSHRFVRCPHCKMPHDAAEQVCPTTGRRIEGAIAAAAAARSRMSELPPPERRPEPLGFDPAKHRIAEREAAARSDAQSQSGGLQRPATGTLQPTRNLQTDLIGRTVSDRYVIKGVLGEGGMGTVYEAEHLGLGRAVAIKVLNPAQAKKRVAVKRFQQEARAAGAIGHPNICEVYDLGLLDDGSPYLVMEKLIGTTLADRIQREGGLPFDEIADVMNQVLAGLIAAHDKGIVHRDIKPENIFLARRVGCPPIAKILDFGVSKMMPQFQGGDEQLDLTRTGMVMGTPYYMSPEQARGERNLDGRVDVYACGVMMYESIIGKRPFLAPNYNALLLSIINTTPKPLHELRPATPPQLEAIVVRAMARARDDRYPTANSMLRDVQSLPVAGPTQQRIPPPPTADERHRAPVMGARQGSRPAHDDPAARSTRGGGRPPPGRTPETHEGAGATLRSRMADAQPPSRLSGDGATRLDIKPGEALTRKPGSDSYEIPMHITGSDLNAIPQPPPRQPGPRDPRRQAPPVAAGEYVDEMPTEIFRPGMHQSPSHMAARSPSATRIAGPQHHPPPRRDAKPPQAASQRVVHQRPSSPPPPVNLGALVGDDWDGETIVKRPAALRDAKPFDPSETVNLQGDIDVDVDFNDETNIGAPPRRR